MSNRAEIRRRLLKGERQTAIARDLGVSKQYIHQCTAQLAGYKASSVRGSEQVMAVLTEEKVKAARRLYLTGRSTADLAREFTVSYSTLQQALVGKTWKHVPGKIVLRKREFTRGEDMYCAKLTENIVRKMRKDYAAGCSPRFVDLAQQYGVSEAAISYAISGRSWKCVK